MKSKYTIHLKMKGVNGEKIKTHKIVDVDREGAQRQVYSFLRRSFCLHLPTKIRMSIKTYNGILRYLNEVMGMIIDVEHSPDDGMNATQKSILGKKILNESHELEDYRAYKRDCELAITIAKRSLKNAKEDLEEAEYLIADYAKRVKNAPAAKRVKFQKAGLGPLIG